MPRTLPWLDRGAGSRKSKSPAIAKAEHGQKRPSFAENLVTSDLDEIPTTSSPQRSAPKKKINVDRSPSTSPPPAAPDAVYMHEGLAADDIYMMVEDEFDSTAHLFTQHIHHAEYQRLKRLHRSRGAETLKRLVHGTDGKTEQSRALRLQMEFEERARKRKSGVDGSTTLEDSDSDSDSEDEDGLIAGLLTSEQVARSQQEVSGLAKANSNTRAAAGYLQSPHKDAKWKDIPSTSKYLISVCSADDSLSGDGDGSAATLATKKLAKGPQSTSDTGQRKANARKEEFSSARTQSSVPFEGSEMDDGKAMETPLPQQHSSSALRSDLNNSFTAIHRPPRKSHRRSSDNPPTRSPASNVADILARRSKATAYGSALSPSSRLEKRHPHNHETHLAPSVTHYGEPLNTPNASSLQWPNDEPRQPVRTESDLDVTSKEQKRNTRVDDIPTFLF